MPAALASSIRRRIIDAHLAGESLRSIAEREKLSYSSVRTYWRRYRERGYAGLSPDYKNCGHRDRQNDVVYRAARYLKFLHRQWGAPLIRLKLQKRYKAVPSTRTLQRWFKQAHLKPLQSTIPKPEKTWAQAPHEVWQLDAKEHLRLDDGSRACYLSVTDEHSGALLASPSFPLQSDQSS